VAGPPLPVAGGVADCSPPAPVPDCGFGLVGAPLIPVVPPCPAPFVMPPFRSWVAAGAVASEPRGVGVWANAMPVETNRPAAANRAKCFLIILLSLFASLKGNVSKVQLFRLEPAHRHAETTSHIRDCGRRGSNGSRSECPACVDRVCAAILTTSRSRSGATSTWGQPANAQAVLSSNFDLASS
jgi:hypothetical protein